MSLRYKLLMVLLTIPNVQTVAERKALLGYTDCYNLSNRINSWERNDRTFLNELIDQLCSEGQSKLVTFIRNLADNFVGYEDKINLNELSNKIKSLTTEEWRKEFKGAINDVQPNDIQPPVNTQPQINGKKMPSPDVASPIALPLINLKELLENRKWKEADRETTRIIIEALGIQERGWVEETDISKIDDELLENIDRLWRENSYGRFGFSVQGLIWEGICEKISPYDFLKAKHKFGKEVGWDEEGNSGEWILPSDNIDLSNQAKGFLPTVRYRWDEKTINVAVIDALAKKLKCKQRQEELAK